jgi:hypothetical protein|tara:strand:- start:280 stop:513 length:234 start_codon:yes stop_codon:yes gene_type:complete
MSISKDKLLKRKSDIIQDSKKIQDQILEGETTLKQLRNNLNALAGAAQQCDLFIKQIEDEGEPMPPEKAQALDIATS